MAFVSEVYFEKFLFVASVTKSPHFVCPRQQQQQQQQFNNMTSANDFGTMQFLGDRHAIFSHGEGGGGGCCRPTDQMGMNNTNVDVYLKMKQQGQRQKGDDVVILTEGFDKLSMEERNRALAELHGVVDKVEENPTLVEAALKDLETEISRRKKNRAAYERALFLSPHYVKDRDFRLMFLRCERFDVEKAATKLLKHFEIKLELFGYQCLGRDITMDDLEPGALKVLKSGQSYFLNRYDRSGRRLFLLCAERIQMIEARDYLQFSWYDSMNALEDVQTQTNGATMIVFCAGDSIRKPVNPQGSLQYPKVLASVPLFWAGIHFCYEDKTAARMFPNPFSLLQLALDTMTRMKFRAHHGSVVEMKYALVSYGIPSEYLPLDASGMLIDDEFNEQLAMRQIREVERRDRLASSNIIEHPSHLDVLLGRGKPYQDFPGNLRLHRMIELRIPLYEVASWSEKTVITMEIVEAIKKMGGRFLRRRQPEKKDERTATATTTTTAATVDDSIEKYDSTHSSWEEADLRSARRKVVNYFNFRIRNSQEG